MSELLEFLTDVARQAAGIINAVYSTPFEVDYKSPRDPVTEADRRANALICARLAEKFPGVPVVAEESDPATFADYRRASRVFFVDPLDGTREFVKKNGEFVVMIGVLDAGRPKAGVIHAPATGATWLGEVGHGAELLGTDGSRTPLAVSKTSLLSASRLLSTRSHRSPALEAALAALEARQIDPLGSAGLKCVEVAAGGAEAYVAPAKAGSRWDICAGEAIILAAGGMLTDAYGDQVDYLSESLINERGIVASNGRVHAEILARWAEVRRRTDKE
ncbi:MAG: 3'(2'),5'-bisphosphate nucleotidase CysQ [Myxococcales bacterium]|nr:3'(2'),5'-bisphosphate nucleotidase CysQ [Myxococcales bacterium]